MEKKLEVKSIKEKNELKYLKGFEIHYLDKLGKEKTWELVSRKGIERLKNEVFDGKSYTDGAMVIATDIEKKNVVILKEYRVSAGKYVYMFPAGLIETGEPLERAAIREFKEETGMDFEPVYSSVERYVSVGIVNEKINAVYGYYSGTPSNKYQESSEDAEILIIGASEAARILENEEVSIRTALILENLFKLNPFLK